VPAAEVVCVQFIMYVPKYFAVIHAFGAVGWASASVIE